MQKAPKIPFNKPFIAGKELFHIAEAVIRGHISGDGVFTQKCSRFLEEQFGIEKVLMTPSCTAALEMAARLCDLGPGDEVIMPSFTFVSTANAAVQLGARPAFIDIRPDTLNLDENLIEEAVTERTRAIFPMHYASIGCEMDPIMEIARRHDLMVVEDAAQAVNAFYKGKALGTIGDLGAYSFHETKNYICGEGGSICINRPDLKERAEIIRDKGTNRQKFFRGEVDKYTWVDIGSSHVPSEITSAFLFGQLELLEEIAVRRFQIYDYYSQSMQTLADDELLSLPQIPVDCTSSYHMFYILLPNEEIRNQLMEYMRRDNIQAVFHYVPLHDSPMGSRFDYSRGDLPITENLSGRLLRLPFYYEISQADQNRVVASIESFLKCGPGI